MKGFLVYLLLPALLLAGCAGRDATENADQETDEAVARRYEDFPPAQPQRCISARNIRKVDPVGNHSLLFYFRNGEVWRSRLRSRCIGLHPRVVFSTTSGPAVSAPVTSSTCSIASGSTTASRASVPARSANSTS